MENKFIPCVCQRHRPKPYRALTILLLDCWQRKYDKRPYSTLLLNRKSFEGTFNRTMDVLDFEVLLEFLAERYIENFELNYMTMPSSDAGYIMKPMINALSNMLNVSLCHVSLSIDALKLLSMENNINMSKIKCLRLSGNALNREHAFYLNEFLFKNQTIRYLDIGFCSLDHTIFATIADGILASKSLRAIDVSRIVPCHTAHTTDQSKITLLLSILMWSNQMFEIHLKHCNFDGHDILPIAECISRRCTNLTYLDLGSNNIGVYGTEVLFEAIRTAPNLIGLDISNNNVGGKGGEIIAHNLPFTHIRYLDIGRNDIDADVMFLILTTIKKSYHIRILNIQGNKFDYNVGAVLKRHLDGKILLIESADVVVTYDESEHGYRIVPIINEKAEYNKRYHRVVPFHRKYDAAPNLLWHDVNKQKLLVNGLFIDPIFVNDNGNVFSLDKYGNKTEAECTNVYNF